MNNNSLAKFGGTCAILVAIVGALADITYLLLPAEQRLGALGKDLLPSFHAAPTILTLELWELAIAGALGLAVVAALSQKVGAMNDGWAHWTAILAYVGFAVSAVGNVLTLDRLPRVAAAFVAGDASAKAAIAATWKSTLDPLGLFGFGAIGLWIFVVSLLTLRDDAFPKPLAYIGLLLGIVNWLVPLALLFKLAFLFFVVSVAGLVLGGIWYVWIGLNLRRTA
jgi:hypothetical protein